MPPQRSAAASLGALSASLGALSGWLGALSGWLADRQGWYGASWPMPSAYHSE